MGKHLRRLTFWSRFHSKARYSLSVVSQKRHEKINSLKEEQEPEISEPPRILKCLMSDDGGEAAKDVLNVEGHDISEEKSWRIAANVGAVAVACTTFFLFGYFA